ncbi:MAG: hypothetical protein HUU06_02925 [Planctomycetaceae bacterium]|nr:hypothetical protein [Planctomycetaceae bacterium]
MGFSPKAIFMLGGAPSKRMASTVPPSRSLRTAACPPTRLALPGRTITVVTPPARASAKAGSSALRESTALTSGRSGSVASFPSEFASTEGQE